MRKSKGGLPTLRELQKEEEKASTLKRSRRNKVIALAVIAAALLGVIGFAVYNMVNAASSPESRISSLVPENADTVVVAPSSKEWWDKVTKMAPLEFGVSALDPYEKGMDITSLGYARFDDTKKREIGFTGPVRGIYIQSSTEEGATKIENWLLDERGAEVRSTFRQGTVVNVTYNWVTEFDAPQKNVESRSDFSLEDSQSDGSMWINFDNQIDSLSGKDNPEKPLVTKYFEKTFALKPGTSWSGTSSDGVTWEGEYVRGGLDMNLFNPEDARSALAGTQETLAGGKQDGQQVKILDNRLYSLILNSGARKTGESVNFGAVEVVSGDFGVKDEKLGVAIDPSQWNTAVRGLSGQTEGVTKIDMSLSDSAMNLVFRYGADITVEDIPEPIASIPADATPVEMEIEPVK